MQTKTNYKGLRKSVRNSAKGSVNGIIESACREEAKIASLLWSGEGASLLFQLFDGLIDSNRTVL